MANVEIIKFQNEMVQSMRDEMRESGDKERSCNKGEPEEREFSITVAFLYCLSLITTIGYPYQGPKSGLGKLLSIGIACIGLPIFLLYICLVGRFLGRHLQ